MTRTLNALAAALVVAIGASLAAQSSAPDIAFDSNADLLKTPDNVYVGEIGGVGQNSKGQIFVYTRTGHPFATLGDNRTFLRGGSRLFVFDKTGKFERELGQDVYGFNAAIGLRVDLQDNVWTIDVAASQIVKFDPEGRVALVLGRKPEAINVRSGAPGGGGRGAPEGGRGTPPSEGGRGTAPEAGRGAAPGGRGAPGSGLPGSTARCLCKVDVPAMRRHACVTCKVPQASMPFSKPEMRFSINAGAGCPLRSFS